VYNQYNTIPGEMPRAFAVPVGTTTQPFQDKDRREIAESLHELLELIDKWGYTHVYWPMDLDGKFAVRRGYPVSKRIIRYLTIYVPFHCNRQDGSYYDMGSESE
jgi:hypothetical protein